MKPIIIIAIAVVCSIAGTLGVLIAWQSMATIQAQEIYDDYQEELEKQQEIQQQQQEIAYQKNKDLCAKMFSSEMVMFGETHPYQYCLDNGIDLAIDLAISECIGRLNSLSYESAKATCDYNWTQKLMDNSPEFKELVEQETKLMLEEEIAEQKRIESYENISLDEIRLKYMNCNSGLEEFAISCDNLLSEMIQVHCINLVPNDIPMQNQCGNIEYYAVKENSEKTFEKEMAFELSKNEYLSLVDQCRFHSGLSPYLEDSATTNCVCSQKIDYVEWHELCN